MSYMFCREHFSTFHTLLEGGEGEGQGTLTCGHEPVIINKLSQSNNYL